MSSHRIPVDRFVLAFLLASFTGCGSESRPAPTSSALPPAGNAITQGADHSTRGRGGWDEFYPLQVGYRQVYVAHTTFRPEPFAPLIEVRRVEEHEIIGTEELFGRTYFVEQRRIHETSPLGDREYTQWVRYRQDRSGLYEADVCYSDEPGPGNACKESAPSPDLAGTGSIERHRLALDELTRRAMEIRHPFGGRRASGVESSPGGEPEERTDLNRLLYPLHPGAEWFVRPEGQFLTEVLAREIVMAGGRRHNAWKTSITPPGFGPNDIAHFWYDTTGLVRAVIHIEHPLYGNYDEVIEAGAVYGLAIY